MFETEVVLAIGAGVPADAKVDLQSPSARLPMKKGKHLVYGKINSNVLMRRITAEWDCTCGRNQTKLTIEP